MSLFIRLTALGFCLLIPAPIALAGGPGNLDFEEDEVGDAPAVWFTSLPGYAAEVRAKGARQGKQFVRLSSQKGTQRGAFGNLMQSFDAKPYRGKTVRFRAAVRTNSPAGNKAQMWLRVDRKDQSMGFFDNMDDRPITGAQWKHYEIVGEIDHDAETINIGIMLRVEGRVDFDDVSFAELKPDKASKKEPPRALSDTGLDNLIAFTRLYGYVRFFHPSMQSAKTDWNAFAIQGVRTVESASSPEALAKSLAALVRSIAPTVRVFPTGKQPETPAELQKPIDTTGTSVVRRKHTGVGLNSAVSGPYSSKRQSIEIEDGELPKGFRDPAEPLIADLGGGVSCMIPLSLYEREDEGENQPVEDGDSIPTPRFTALDRSTRLADVIIAWNIFQHFYPYFDVIETDWPAALKAALRKAAQDSDERLFLTTLRELVAQLHDGHGMVSHATGTNQYTLPLQWHWVGDQLVVTSVKDDHKKGPRPGDVVEEIDGRPVSQLFDETAKTISAATPQWRRCMFQGILLGGNSDEEVTLALRKPSGQRYKVKLTRVAFSEMPQENRPEKIAEIKPDIFYIDVQRVVDEDFEKALPKLQKAKGIIFDYRGYPRLKPKSLFMHFIQETVTSPQWHIPETVLPDRKDVKFKRDGEWQLPPIAPYVKAKLAFLIDNRAISYSESCLGIVEHYKLGEIIGEPTAGTNGNVNPFSLPGGYTISWTGMKVLKHDGSRHHGVGIQPTIPLSPTIEGIAAGRDEQLEKAIEVVLQE